MKKYSNFNIIFNLTSMTSLDLRTKLLKRKVGNIIESEVDAARSAEYSLNYLLWQYTRIEYQSSVNKQHQQILGNSNTAKIHSKV